MTRAFQRGRVVWALLLVVGVPALGRMAVVSAQSSQSPPLQITGHMTLAPDHGPVGPAFTVSGSGLEPNLPLTVVWTDVDGAWHLSDDGASYLGRTFTPRNTVLTTVTPDDSGSFAVQVTAPAGFGDEHDVLLQRSDGVVVNKAAFNVDMEVSISPTSGPAGTPITITSRGIGFRAGDDSWQVSYDAAYTGWLSAVTSHGNATAVIPATGAPGVHTVAVMHGDFTFPYLNPQQSPYAGRPEWHLPFTVTAGAPVLPPAPETQALAPDQVDTPDGDGLALGPASGTVGSPLTVTARNLPADKDVVVGWSSIRGNRISGQGFAGTTGRLGTAHTDVLGQLVWQTAVPDDLGGPHTVSVLDGDQTVATAQFIVTPSALPLLPAAGPAGTRTLVHLKGVGWTETANIYTVDVDNAFAGYACGFNSNGDVQIYLDMPGASGWHFIDLYPAIYKGTEDSPINFRIPQLTYAADHPGERLPAFHFAFQVTAIQ